MAVRRVGFYDAKTNKHYVFITNHLDWSAKIIADIYKQRWQVELFFKWIKQNLKIKAFMGDTDNAVMTQVWVVLCVYLILAYLKFQARISQSLQQMSRLIHLNLFVKRDLIQLFRPPPDLQIDSPQLGLLFSLKISGTAVLWMAFSSNMVHGSAARIFARESVWAREIILSK